VNERLSPAIRQKVKIKEIKLSLIRHRQDWDDHVQKKHCRMDGKPAKPASTCHNCIDFKNGISIFEEVVSFLEAKLSDLSK